VSQGPQESDRPIAVAAVGGDKRAFEELVRRHKSALYRFVRRYVGEPDDAYDVVQESFVSAWTALPRFDVQQSFGSWLRTIALNKCRDYGRRKSVRRRLLMLFALENHPQIATASTDAESDAGSEESLRLRLLDQAIAELPRLYKEPLLLTAFSGLTHQEAAMELKTTTKAIEMRIRRAKKKLINALGSVKSLRPEG
jgi:RNA polymerase sigma-70 factor (ECF subfamily)